MSTQRLSLSSPSMSGRVKKYDSYVHRPASSSRPIRQMPVSAASQTQPVQTQSLQKPNPKMQVSNVRNRQMQRRQNGVARAKSSPSASHIALQSVRNSKEHVDDDGVITRQFNDDNQVVYSPVKGKTSRLQKAMYVFGVLVFAFSAFTSLQTLFTNKQAQEQIATLGARTDEQGVSEGTGSEPSEDPISDQAIAAYQVSPEDPRYLRIPALGVFARIKNLGIDSNGAVDAPWNLNDTGWYNGSVRPGSRVGSSLILGHVSGWTAPGVFKNLKNLKDGTQFEIEKGSGEIVKYEVVRSESIPLDQVNMSKILGTVEAGKHDVKLMTCGGKYNRETKTYEERYVVYAKHVN